MEDNLRQTFVPVRQNVKIQNCKLEMESKLTQTLIYVKDRDKVKSIKIIQKKWWMKRCYFFNPFPFSHIPPSPELFNFNTSCVSAGPEIAQASKNSQ